MTKVKGRKNSKIRKLISKQTAEERDNYSEQIRKIMSEDLKIKIEIYMKKYRMLFDRKLGKTEDDIENELREKIWHGLISYRKGQKANLQTFLKTIIANYFKDSLDQLNSTKYNSIEYFGDVYASASVDKEHLETDETGETLYLKREEFMKDLVRLSVFERSICRDLIEGFKLQEMAERHSVTIPEVVAAINRIDSRLKARRTEAA